MPPFRSKPWLNCSVSLSSLSLFLFFSFSFFFPFASLASSHDQIKFQEIKPALQVPFPGVQLSSVFADQANLYVSYLPEYIAAGYSYLVGIAGILAAVMIMYGGTKWIFAGGDSSKITTARETIVHAVIGLVLALGSYLILFSINPDLVKFKALKLLFIPRELLIPETDEGDTLTTPPSGVTQPTWGYATFDCGNPPAPAGVVEASQVSAVPLLSRIVTPPGLRVHQNLIEPLKKINTTLETISQNEGVNYKLKITSGYRPFETQVAIWCGQEGSCASNYPAKDVRKSYCAVPGFSNHGLGIALDVKLLKDGREITSISSKTQCQLDPKAVAKLANIFYQSDGGWKRYEKEIWHFEYNPVTPSFRSQTTSLPPGC
ncbi:D-alanyl-D-alanine carboxypeptidase family protein [Candidatus Uhrbacteria bacterium]|nr:D-alanyl-D-alanine carboxypeptidase family protein [Candidatus Uhrbacteria bacterium]